MEDHPELHEPPKYKFSIIKTYRTSLERQIGEAIEIATQDPATLINTETEWGVNPLPQQSVVFLDRVLEDHLDFDNSGGNQAPTSAGKRKTMAGRARDSEQEFVDRLRRAKEQADNVKTRGDSFSNQYRQRKKARMATMAAEAACSLSQRGQEVAMQPDDHRDEDSTGPQPYPERAEQEQSQAFSTESRVQDPERQYTPREPIIVRTRLQSPELNSR